MKEWMCAEDQIRSEMDSEIDVQKVRRREEKGMLPKDPAMLLSFVNMKLRDFYKTPDALWEDLDVDGKEITDKLTKAGYHYDQERNQFVS